jgi:hypothetical protein
MTGWILALLLTSLLLMGAGCDGQGMTIYKYDGTVIAGQLVSGDFESEELVVRLSDRSEQTIRFNEIKRLEMGQPRR